MLLGRITLRATIRFWIEVRTVLTGELEGETGDFKSQSIINARLHVSAPLMGKAEQAVPAESRNQSCPSPDSVTQQEFHQLKSPRVECREGWRT